MDGSNILHADYANDTATFVEYPRPRNALAERAFLKLVNMFMIEVEPPSKNHETKGWWTMVIHKCSGTLCKEFLLGSKAISQFLVCRQLTASHMEQAAVLGFELTIRSSRRAGSSWPADPSTCHLLQLSQHPGSAVEAWMAAKAHAGDGSLKIRLT